jgi:hypothetical protein
MQGLGDLHGNDGKRYSQGGCQPYLVGNEVMNRYSDGGADEVTTNQVAWLRQRTVDHSIDQYGRSTERPNEKQRIAGGKIFTAQQAYQGNTNKGTYKGEHVFTCVNKGFAVYNVAHFAVAAFDGLYGHWIKAREGNVFNKKAALKRGGF